MSGVLDNTVNQCGKVVDDCAKTITDVPEGGLIGIGTNVGNLAKDTIDVCPAVIKDITGEGASSDSTANTTSSTTGSTGSTGGTTTNTTNIYNETTNNQKNVNKQIVVDPAPSDTTTTTTTYYTVEN